MNYFKHIFFTTILLVATVVLFQFTDLDIEVENFFYNFQTHKWLVDENNKLLDLIFYSGIKKVLVAFGLSLLFILIFLRNKPLFKPYKKGLLVVVLSFIFIPLIVGGLKDITNTPCPNDLKIYGGEYPDIKVLTPYPPNSPLKCKNVRCWPAGHASGGFALMALFFLFKSKKNKLLALSLGLSVGWSMGLYKMFVGDHFLSHTIVTMLFAYLIMFIIARLIYGDEYPTLNKTCYNNNSNQ